MKSSQELIMKVFIICQTKQNDDFTNQNLQMSEVMTKLAYKVDSIATHNKMMETKNSHVAQQQTSPCVLSRILLGQPEPNPKG